MSKYKAMFPKNKPVDRLQKAALVREVGGQLSQLRGEFNVLENLVNEIPGVVTPIPGVPVAFSIAGRRRAFGETYGVILNEDVLILPEDEEDNNYPFLSYADALLAVESVGARLMTKAEWDEVVAKRVPINLGLQEIKATLPADYIYDSREEQAWYWIEDVLYPPVIEPVAMAAAYNSVTEEVEYFDITSILKGRGAVDLATTEFILPYSYNNQIVVTLLGEENIPAYNPIRGIMNINELGSLTAGDILSSVEAEDDSDQAHSIQRRIDDWYLGTSGDYVALLTNAKEFVEELIASDEIWTSTEVDADLASMVNFGTLAVTSEGKDQLHIVIPIREFVSDEVFEIGDVQGGGIIFNIVEGVESNTYYVFGVWSYSNDPWGLDGTLVDGTSAAVGEGSSNTAAIVALLEGEGNWQLTAAGIAFGASGVEYSLLPLETEIDTFYDELKVISEQRFGDPENIANYTRTITMWAVLSDDIVIEVEEGVLDITVSIEVENSITIVDGDPGDPTTKTVEYLKIEAIKSTNGAWQYYQIFRDNVELSDGDIVYFGDVFRVTSDSFNLTDDYIIYVNPI